MYSKSGDRANKGKVGLQPRGNSIQLNLPRPWFDSEQVRFSLGIPNTPENWALAESIAKQIEKDYILESLPDTVEGIKKKYRPKSHLTVVETIKPVAEPKLDEIWDKFIEFKRSHCSPSTMKKQYKTFTAYIRGTKNREGLEIKLPTYDLSRAVEIRDYCLKVIPIESCKRFIVRLSACCDWAMKSGMISKNPFQGMSEEIEIPKAQKSNGMNEIEDFTSEEREAILEAFAKDTFRSKYTKWKHSHYYNFIFFLFNTGCRPSEAVALQWGDISPDCRYIHFQRAVVDSEEGDFEKEGLKTQSERKFGRCSQKMCDFLASIKPENAKPEDLVFPSPSNGGWIDTNNFRNINWKCVLQGLGIKYRKLYNTRHTFITLALQNGMTVKDVARLVGNSPEVIYRHYAGNKRDLQLPEF